MIYYHDNYSVSSRFLKKFWSPAMFCERLKMIRKQRNLTQKQVFTAIGLGERNYQSLEYGTIKPSYDTLLALADYFGVSIDFLTGHEEASFDNNIFAARFAFCRDDNNISLVDVSRDLNFKGDSVRRWANGQTLPDYGQLIKLADYFNVSVDYLLGRTEKPELNQ